MAETASNPGSDPVDDALSQAQSAVDAMLRETAGAGSMAPALPDFAAIPREGLPAGGLEMLGDVELHVTVELGRTEMLVEDVLRLGEGSVVELDKLAGDPVDVYVNQRLVARGEVLVLNDNFCIRISEIVDDLREQAREAAAQSAA